MSKFLVYIGEGEKFNVGDAVSAISGVEGVSNAREGVFIGAIFECDYEWSGLKAIVRISSDAETVTVDGLGDESIKFIIDFQNRFNIDLHVIDMEYSFNIPVRPFSTIEEFKHAAGMA